MANYSNNYTTVNDCDSATANVAVSGGSTAVIATETTQVKEGGASISWTSDDIGWNVVAFDISAATGSNTEFKVTEFDFLMWMYYVKGKSSNILFDTPNAFQIKLYFGAAANGDYALYPQGGDSTLNFGWETYRCSGKTGIIPGGSNHNGTTDWDLNVTKVDLMFNVENAMTVSGTTTYLYFDELRYGNNITITSGTSASPKTIDNLLQYDEDDGSLTSPEVRPLGVISKKDNLINFRCGLTLGDGTAASAGHFATQGSFVLFNQLSEEVKYDVKIKSYSSLVFGQLEEGTDGVYPTDGCQIVQPSGSYADIQADSGSVFKVFDGKLFRWRDITLGQETASGGTTDIEFRRVDIDECENVIIKQPVTWEDVEVHDNTTLVSAHSGEVLASASEFTNVKVYNCEEGFRFLEDITIDDYLATDNGVYDLSIKEGKDVVIVNGIFDEDKIKRIK